jgi:hypothetical protein
MIAAAMASLIIRRQGNGNIRNKTPPKKWQVSALLLPPPCVVVVAADELNYNPAKRQCVLIISRLLLLPGRAYINSYTRGSWLLALYRATCQTHATERRAEKMSWRMLNPIRARAGEREKEKVRPGRI